MHILGGQHKGRKLLSPPASSSTRPMTGSVKKSLFDILREELVEATVLDLYCGTGTLGLEALSRGAARCIFVERDPRVVERLRRNIAALGVADRCRVWCGDLRGRLTGWLAGLEGGLDLVFVDPPFAAARQWSWPAATRQVFEPVAARLADGGCVVLRLPRDSPPPAQLGPLAATRVKRYGQMVLATYARQGREEKA